MNSKLNKWMKLLYLTKIISFKYNKKQSINEKFNLKNTFICKNIQV